MTYPPYWFKASKYLADRDPKIMSRKHKHELTPFKKQRHSKKFSQTFSEQVSNQVTPLLNQFEEISLSLAARSNEEVIWKPPENLHELLDHYLETLSVVYLKKYSVFSQCLIQVLNEENYLLYGLVGRSIIEHTAILRYYITSKMLPLAEDVVADGKITESEIEELIQLLDRHLAGRRFDWDNFLADYLQKIKGLKPESGVQPTQVNILTCLEKWGRENPKIIHLYELFCDLVHPNLGSTLLITRLLDEQLVLGGSRGIPVGLEIFNRTFAELLKLFHEVQKQLIQLQSLKFSKLLSLKSSEGN
ncbi:MAG: hypothetical protein QNJ54_20295 [Prochloraceae cyanobacterium]|nr:hypothetical protein [Prochloraceae cyanobacterium]